MAAWGKDPPWRALAGLACKTAVHISDGYGIKVNTDWNQTLGSEWRQYEQTFPLLRDSKIDQISLECLKSRMPIELISLLDGKDVLVGAIDLASNRIETPEEVATTICQALPYVAPVLLYPCTNCDMVPLSQSVALGKLQALAKGAALMR